MKCVCVSIYIYIYTSIDVYIYIYIFIYLFMYIYINIHICMMVFNIIHRGSDQVEAPGFTASAMPGAEAMTAEALRAEIAATRRLQQAAEGRGQELDEEIRQADERQRLRRELDEAREDLEEQEATNRCKAGIRQGIDADRPGFALGHPSAHVNRRQGGGNHASAGESRDFGHTVASGEFVWELRHFSWLQSALKQQKRRAHIDYTESGMFQVGCYDFYFMYHPQGGKLNSCRPAQHGTLAIVPETDDRILLRYSIFVRKRGGDFVQWGESCDEMHHLDEGCYEKAYGPDVHEAGFPPEVKGIFGLTHDQLRKSDWVENDTLTVKFVLEVRPDEIEEIQSLPEIAEVPGPTIINDTHALLQNGKGSDVRFMVHGQVIHAHSQVLCARSDVFDKQLAGGMKESVTKEIVIEDCDFVTFKAFLKFLYTDNLPGVEELSAQASSAAWSEHAGSAQLSHMQALLAVSHKYQVTRLQRWCEKQLSERLSAAELCGLLRQAHLLQAEQLERACLSYLKAHMAEVVKLPAYGKMIKAWPQIALKINFYMLGAQIPVEDMTGPEADRKRKRDTEGL